MSALRCLVSWLTAYAYAIMTLGSIVYWLVTTDPVPGTPHQSRLMLASQDQDKESIVDKELLVRMS